ncbi:MAG: alanine dehydrogenase, partial [Alphaproteobacteria bacterium]|nr:alanine dehydrogenase [Alphaproteobacteria bacterium]
MVIGVLRELKPGEQRVGLVPAFAASLVKQGHEVLVEAGAGVGAGFTDDDYAQAGTTIVTDADEVWERAKLVVKVKEPLRSEYEKIREDQVLFTYLHLAPDVEQTDALVKSKAACIAYETVTDENGRLPLLAPMSCIAGRMSILVAANLLQKHFGGIGNLPCGVPGVLSSKVVILGGGYVGQNAAFVAHGIGADVTVLDNRQQALERVTDIFHGAVKTAYSNLDNIEHLLPEADIVIGAALVAGAFTPKLVSRSMVSKMQKG